MKKGDRVQVTDPGLAKLREIFGPDAPPNHHGTVERIEGDLILINFDDGCSAPYPTEEVLPL